MGNRSVNTLELRQASPEFYKRAAKTSPSRLSPKSQAQLKLKLFNHTTTTAMPPRPLPQQALRLTTLPHQRLLSQTRTRLQPTAKRSSSSSPELPSRPTLDPITLHRLEVQRIAYYKRRSIYAAIGCLCGMAGIWFTAMSIPLDPPPGAAKMDSGRKDDPLVVLGRQRKVVVQKLGEEPKEIPDVVETGTSTVPTFPRVLAFADSGEGETEYQLVGLGIRTVSFLGIQVYVVGMFVATEDIAALQGALIQRIAPGASTLVAGEKDKLKALLYDPEEGEKVWGEVLRDTGIRTLIRIVPTRNTDFHHLRDGWVRQITARAQLPVNKAEYGEESFGAAMGEFKKLFNRGSVPKQKELLLARGKRGELAVWYDDGKAGAQRLGEVRDERISRAVWLNYLAGKTVASEGARKSIVDGVIEFVERPVGTVATQVKELVL